MFNDFVISLHHMDRQSLMVTAIIVFVIILLTWRLIVFVVWLFFVRFLFGFITGAISTAPFWIFLGLVGVGCYLYF